MPGYLSHYLFSIGTARRLTDSKAYDILMKYKKTFCLGGEGPDIFLYYVPCHLREKPSLGHRLHKSCSKQFIANAIEYVNNRRNPEEKDVLYAYLCGLICHYTLDTIAHPYVEALANPNLSCTNKALCSYQHCNLESNLDTNLLFKYLHKLPSEQNYLSITRPPKKERKSIAAFLSTNCNLVYRKEKSYHLTNPSQMYRVVTLFPFAATCLRDKNGIKKPVFSTLERVLHSPYRPSCVMSSDDLQINLDYLNLAHKEWYSPFEPERIREESFLDLFRQGIHSAYKRCQMLYSIVYESEVGDYRTAMTDALLDDIGNLSYNTGLIL